ncbi:hypothetical protein [Pasteurella sp. PK-2025]|uniref:hypothetical protein n=1 Tax=unclassified Pasteurella TaxID=2621516 RepID=UPI003C7153A6
MDFRLSIWVGRNISQENCDSVFKLNNQTKEYNASKFIIDFNLDKENDFFDERHVIILH